MVAGVEDDKWKMVNEIILAEYQVVEIDGDDKEEVNGLWFGCRKSGERNEVLSIGINKAIEQASVLNKNQDMVGRAQVIYTV